MDSPRYTLSGSDRHKKITFHAQLVDDLEIQTVIKCDELTIDLEKVSAINSLGIRSWVIWIDSMKTIDLIKLKNCQPNFINQVNMVKGIVDAKTRVESFYVPFYSEALDEEKKVLLVRGRDYGDDFLNLPRVFDSQNQMMGIDVPTDRYFGFLNLKVESA